MFFTAKETSTNCLSTLNAQSNAGIRSQPEDLQTNLQGNVRYKFGQATFLYRDLIFCATDRAQYQIGTSLRDASNFLSNEKFGGFAGNTGFLIISSDASKIQNLPGHLVWGVGVLPRNELFKVIDVRSFD